MRYPAIAAVLLLAVAATGCGESPAEPQTEECEIPEGMVIHPPVPGGELPCQSQ